MKNSRALKIGEKIVRPGYTTYIIMEVASTHANDWNLAKDYVKQAKEAGADAVKFQLFTADGLLNPLSSMLRPTYEYFKTAETPRDWFPKLKKLCEEEGIDLLCTPFDEDAATFLNDLGLPAIKIASGDLTHHKLLEHVVKFKKPIILSTGVATMQEVEDAVKVLKNAGCEQLAVLQCVSVYPMPYEAANVRVMQTFQNKFNTVVGYSDNGSKGIVVPLVAVALGASIIEKHVTSQKQRGNMDDVFSISVDEFREMVRRIREIEKKYRGKEAEALSSLREEFGEEVELILGNGVKQPSSVAVQRPGEITGMDEWRERRLVRRGIYPKRKIPKGTTITKDVLIALRPDIGVSSMEYYKILGAKAAQDLPAKHPIKLEDSIVTLFRKQDLFKKYTHPKEQETIKALVETITFK